MSRFRRLSQSEVASLYRCAQEQGVLETVGQIVCPRCGGPFPKDQIEEKRVQYGRYMYTCPLCHKPSPSTAFGEVEDQPFEPPPPRPQRRVFLDNTTGIGMGVNLTNNPTALRVNPIPRPGTSTIV